MQYKTEFAIGGTAVLAMAIVLLLPSPQTPQRQEQHTKSVAIKPVGPTITLAQLRSYAPRGRPEILQAITANWGQTTRLCRLTNTKRVRHFLTQITHETDGLRNLREDMRYSSKRLRQVFRRHVTPQRAREIAYKPRLIANQVYGHRLGNRGRHTNDGWNYRGSGFLHVTGRANFVRFNRHVQGDIVANPELARQPKTALQLACAYWRQRKRCNRRTRRCYGLNHYADRDNTYMVSLLINGGTNGLRHRRRLAKRAKRVFSIGARPEAADEWEVVFVDEAEATPVRSEFDIEMGVDSRLWIYQQEIENGDN